MEQEHLRGHITDALARLEIIREHLLKVYAMLPTVTNKSTDVDPFNAWLDDQIIHGHLEAAIVDAHRVTLSLICAKGEPVTEAERS